MAAILQFFLKKKELLTKLFVHFVTSEAVERADYTLRVTDRIIRRWCIFVHDDLM